MGESKKNHSKQKSPNPQFVIKIVCIEFFFELTIIDMISIVIKTIRFFFFYFRFSSACKVYLGLCRQPLPHFKEDCNRTFHFCCWRSKRWVLSGGVRPQECKNTDRHLRLDRQTLQSRWRLRRWPLFKNATAVIVSMKNFRHGIYFDKLEDQETIRCELASQVQPRDKARDV